MGGSGLTTSLQLRAKPLGKPSLTETKIPHLWNLLEASISEAGIT